MDQEDLARARAQLAEAEEAAASASASASLPNMGVLEEELDEARAELAAAKISIAHLETENEALRHRERKAGQSPR